MPFGQYSSFPRNLCCPGVELFRTVLSSARCFLYRCCMIFEKPVSFPVREMPRWHFHALSVRSVPVLKSLTRFLLDMSDIGKSKHWNFIQPEMVWPSKVLQSEWILFHSQRPICRRRCFAPLVNPNHAHVDNLFTGKAEHLYLISGKYYVK